MIDNQIVAALADFERNPIQFCHPILEAADPKGLLHSMEVVVQELVLSAVTVEQIFTLVGTP